MNGRFLVVFLALCCSGSAPAFAQSGKVTADTSLPASDPRGHSSPKPKTQSHLKKQTSAETSAIEAKPTQTIPMDFSSFDKKPDRLRSESESTESSGQGTPSLGTNSNGGISPGMKFNF